MKASMHRNRNARTRPRFQKKFGAGTIPLALRSPHGALGPQTINNVVGRLALFNPRLVKMQHRTSAPDDRLRRDSEFDNEPHDPASACEHGVRKDVARLPGIASQLIGERMRAMYTTIVSEPVPDELLDLIRRLESKERGG
jgi:hypothetical protein